MIYWAPFLHFYQPPTQYHNILKKICDEAYRPLLKVFLEHASAKATINICGVLTELLNEHNTGDILEAIRVLARNKQIEFVDSAKYHAILPLVPQKEAIRQIELNRKTNEEFFKDIYKPRGVFPPEMGYSDKVAMIVKNMGYDWILISGIACQDKWPLDFISSVSYGSKSLFIFYRDDILSNKISFRNIDAVGFFKEMVNISRAYKKKDAYFITAMDAETFGHHIKNWETLFLAKAFEGIEKKEVPNIEVTTISELIKRFPAQWTRGPRASSWSTSKHDILNRNYYPLWKNKNNKIHQLQWEHLRICIELTNLAQNKKIKSGESAYFANIARHILDKALHSCQFWWANKSSGRWDVNLINKGLILQKEAIFNAYKTIKLSSLNYKIKRNCLRRIKTSRAISNRIRNLLLA